MSARLEVLIPTFERPAALAVEITSLAAQTVSGLRVVISDQTQGESLDERGEFLAAARVLQLHGNRVEWHKHLPRRGMAEQREFLLGLSRAPYVLFLDDDLILDPDLVARMLHALQREGCGFVGCGLIGLSYESDVRPEEQGVEFWRGRVEPETVLPGSAAWQRHRLHNAANLLHLQRRLGLTSRDSWLYKVAWVGGCVLYDRRKLVECGGFRFWPHLAADHAGEDVLAQLRVMARFGGCGLLPSGAYHQELPTTLPYRPVHAEELFHPVEPETPRL
jgi:GT2 family glycosyltransferase